MRHNPHCETTLPCAARSLASRAMLAAQLTMIGCAGWASPTRAGEFAYDRDNQYGAVHVTDRDQPRLPMFDAGRELGAVAVTDRDRSPFQPDGLRAGNYVILPEIGFNTRYDDNMFGSSSKDGDWRHELNAGLKLQSQLPRHLLNMMFGGRVVSFQNHSERNYADGFAAVETRLDINHGHALVGNFVTRLDHEERRDGETPLNARKPVAVFSSRADVGLVRSQGRLSVLLGAGAARKEFRDTVAFDGTSIDQSFRNTDYFSGFAQARYQLSPGYTLTAKGRALREDNRGDEQTNRSSTGFAATVGIDFEPSRLLRFTLEGGIASQDFAQDTLTDIRAAIYEGRLTWLITPLVTLHLKARRSIQQTSIANASGRIDNLYSVAFDYEPIRNLVLSGGLELTASEFAGLARKDDLWIGRFGAEYYYNKHIQLSLNYEHQILESSTDGIGYDARKIMAGVKFRY